MSGPPKASMAWLVMKLGEGCSVLATKTGIRTRAGVHWSYLLVERDEHGTQVMSTAIAPKVFERATQAIPCRSNLADDQKSILFEPI